MPRRLPEFAYPILDTLKRCPAVLTGRGYPLHRNECFHPFFIVGSGRCGTTLLRRILQASPEVHIPPETYVLGHVVDLFLRNRDRSWPFLLHLVLSQFEFHQQFDVFEISLRPLVRPLTTLPERERSLARILDAVYRCHGEAVGASFQRWGDKTPLNVFCLDKILAVFPDARFVNLVRDGVDVVASMLKAAPQGVDLETAADRWKRALGAAETFRRRHPQLCHDVRYEALVTDPSSVVPTICAFLGITFHESMLESLERTRTMADVATYQHHKAVTSPIHEQSVGKGRRLLNCEQRMQVQRLIGADLGRLGYNPAA